jgi:P-type Cu+ transporter
VIWVVLGSKLSGVVAIADPIGARTAEAIRTLEADGIRLVMVTGDVNTTADVTAAWEMVFPA